MTIRKLTCLFAVLFAAGCRGSGSPGGATAATPDGAVGSMQGDSGIPSSTVAPPTSSAELPPGWAFGGDECGVEGVPAGTFPVRIRLLGVENPGYSQVLLDAHVEVTIDDATEPVVENDLAVDLANGDYAWLLAEGFLPDSAGTVHVKIAFDDFGTFDGGDIDARGIPIEFSSSADTFRISCHAVVSLFVGGSLGGTGEERVLLPQLVVRYW